MVKVSFRSATEKINQHFKKNVWIPYKGPDYEEWLLAETGARTRYYENDRYLEFDNEYDYTVFLLKWG